MTKRKAGAYRGARIKHGASKRGAVTREYNAWLEMHKRCRPDFHQADDYFGRGITVCPEWSEFTAFLRDVGHCPEGYTLDRIRNDEGYTPDNVRWATRAEQSRNRRCVKLDFDKAATIRAMHARGMKPIEIAPHFGVSRRQVAAVVAGKVWI